MFHGFGSLVPSCAACREPSYPSVYLSTDNPSCFPTMKEVTKGCRWCRNWDQCSFCYPAPYPSLWLGRNSTDWQDPSRDTTRVSAGHNWFLSGLCFFLRSYPLICTFGHGGATLGGKCSTTLAMPYCCSPTWSTTRASRMRTSSLI